LEATDKDVLVDSVVDLLGALDDRNESLLVISVSDLGMSSERWTETVDKGGFVVMFRVVMTVKRLGKATP
jgi:hypothetical protein